MLFQEFFTSTKIRVKNKKHTKMKKQNVSTNKSSKYLM